MLYADPFLIGMKKLHFRSQIVMALAACLLIIIGSLLLSVQYFGLFGDGGPAVPPTSQIAAKPGPNVISGNPVHIDIPSLNLSLPVIPGYYNAQTHAWTLTTDKVQYAVITPLPNNAGGNTFLYGHYRWGLFASLHVIKPGAEVSITTDNGHVFMYRFISSRETSPYDDSLFKYQGKPILTIQTCSGLFFQNRQLFTFDLERVV